MKLSLFLSVLASGCVMQPAVAQSINPLEYADRYCYLRGLGVDDGSARRAAVSYSYRMNRPAAESGADIREAVRLTNQICPARDL